MAKMPQASSAWALAVGLSNLTLRAYDRARPIDQTAAGQQARQRWPGAGRHSVLSSSENKLLFVLVYLKTYPLQVVLSQLFGVSTS
jgi:Helix-turn-helix of DDE superfamily endonuclease